MRIVQINCVSEFSSTGRNTSELHEYCKSHGVESHVFCMNKSDKKSNVYYVGSGCDHIIHAILSRITGKQGFFSRKATKKMVAKIEKIHPDVVLLGNLHANFVNLQILLGYLAKKDIATVIVLHDCWFFTGHCTHYTAHGCYKWQTACDSCKLMKLDNPSLFFDTSRFMFEKKRVLFDAIPRLGVIGVSDWITKEAKKSVILRNARLFKRIYNWIDLDKFYPRNTSGLESKLGINDEFVILGVAQGWSWRKGLNTFVELAKLLPDIKVILVGSLAEEFERPINLITPGATESVDELAEYYSLADALLVCSVQETFGKVSAEALACGTPVIANNATANPEVAGSECGMSIDNNDLGSIVTCINKIRQEPSLYYERCIKRARSEFNASIQLQKYLDFFTEIINSKR